MASSVRVSVLPTPPPAGGGKVAAVGPTDHEATFVALVPGIGFRYLDLAAEAPGRWGTAGGFGGVVTGAFGLHHRHGVGATAFVSFVEAPPRSWACMRIPAVGESMSVDEAALVERTAFPADVVAVCGPLAGEVGEEAVVLLSNFTVRFMDLATGKSLGKSLKLDPPAAAADNDGPAPSAVVCTLGRKRATVVRQNGEFFVVELDAEQRRPVLRLKGALGLGTEAMSRGSLLGAALDSTPGEKDRVLLCWRRAGKKTAQLSYCTAVLDAPEPIVQELPPRGSGVAAAWLCVQGYLAEWAQESDKSALSLTVRDARFGMPVASEEVPLPGDKKDGPWLVSTAGGSTLLVGSHGELAAVQWTLPPFGLHLVIGAGQAHSARAEPSGPLAAIHDVAACKRPAEGDPAVEELFSAKRRKATDEALAAEVLARSCPPSEALVELVARRRCWASARALLVLPELDEALATQLLAADAELEGCLLAQAVRRPSTPTLLEAAFADHLPASSLPSILQVLLEWLDAYRDFTAAEIEQTIPGIPSQAEIVRVLSAVAGGCLPSLIRLDGDLLERVVEALSLVAQDRVRTEALHASVRVAARLGAEGRKRRATEAPAVEAVLLEF